MFGLSDSRVLGLIPKVSTVNKVSTEDIVVGHKEMRSIIDKHSNVFEGLCHFGQDVELELKEGAVPEAIPPRQVSNAMRGKLMKELDRLEKPGVISLLSLL